MSVITIIRNLVVILAIIWRINLIGSSVGKGLRWVMVALLGQLSG
ncbi:MAG: nitrate reductase alpha subunit, partial [Zhongshania aliphaticivorans]